MNEDFGSSSIDLSVPSRLTRTSSRRNGVRADDEEDGLRGRPGLETFIPTKSPRRSSRRSHDRRRSKSLQQLPGSSSSEKDREQSRERRRARRQKRRSVSHPTLLEVDEGEDAWRTPPRQVVKKKTAQDTSASSKSLVERAPTDRSHPRPHKSSAVPGSSIEQSGNRKTVKMAKDNVRWSASLSTSKPGSKLDRGRKIIGKPQGSPRCATKRKSQSSKTLEFAREKVHAWLPTLAPIRPSKTLKTMWAADEMLREPLPKASKTPRKRSKRRKYALSLPLFKDMESYAAQNGSPMVKSRSAIVLDAAFEYKMPTLASSSSKLPPKSSNTNSRSRTTWSATDDKGDWKSSQGQTLVSTGSGSDTRTEKSNTKDSLTGGDIGMAPSAGKPMEGVFGSGLNRPTGGYFEGSAYDYANRFKIPRDIPSDPLLAKLRKDPGEIGMVARQKSETPLAAIRMHEKRMCTKRITPITKCKSEHANMGKRAKQKQEAIEDIEVDLTEAEKAQIFQAAKQQATIRYRREIEKRKKRMRGIPVKANLDIMLKRKPSDNMVNIRERRERGRRAAGKPKKRKTPWPYKGFSEHRLAGRAGINEHRPAIEKLLRRRKSFEDALFGMRDKNAYMTTVGRYVHPENKIVLVGTLPDENGNLKKAVVLGTLRNKLLGPIESSESLGPEAPITQVDEQVVEAAAEPEFFATAFAENAAIGRQLTAAERIKVFAYRVGNGLKTTTRTVGNNIASAMGMSKVKWPWKGEEEDAVDQAREFGQDAFGGPDDHDSAFFSSDDEEVNESILQLRKGDKVQLGRNTRFEPVGYKRRVHRKDVLWRVPQAGDYCAAFSDDVLERKMREIRKGMNQTTSTSIKVWRMKKEGWYGEKGSQLESPNDRGDFTVENLLRDERTGQEQMREVKKSLDLLARDSRHDVISRRYRRLVQSRPAAVQAGYLHVPLSEDHYEYVSSVKPKSRAKRAVDGMINIGAKFKAAFGSNKGEDHTYDAAPGTYIGETTINDLQGAVYGSGSDDEEAEYDEVKASFGGQLEGGFYDDESTQEEEEDDEDVDEFIQGTTASELQGAMYGEGSDEEDSEVDESISEAMVEDLEGALYDEENSDEDSEEDESEDDDAMTQSIVPSSAVATRIGFQESEDEVSNTEESATDEFISRTTAGELETQLSEDEVSNTEESAGDEFISRTTAGELETQLSEEEVSNTEESAADEFISKTTVAELETQLSDDSDKVHLDDTEEGTSTMDEYISPSAAEELQEGWGDSDTGSDEDDGDSNESEEEEEEEGEDDEQEEEESPSSVPFPSSGIFKRMSQQKNTKKRVVQGDNNNRKNTIKKRKDKMMCNPDTTEAKGNEISSKTSTHPYSSNVCTTSGRAILQIGRRRAVSASKQSFVKEMSTTVKKYPASFKLMHHSDTLSSTRSLDRRPGRESRRNNLFSFRRAKSWSHLISLAGRFSSVQKNRGSQRVYSNESLPRARSSRSFPIGSNDSLVEEMRDIRRNLTRYLSDYEEYGSYGDSGVSCMYSRTAVPTKEEKYDMLRRSATIHQKDARNETQQSRQSGDYVVVGRSVNTKRGEQNNDNSSKNSDQSADRISSMQPCVPHHEADNSENNTHKKVKLEKEDSISSMQPYVPHHKAGKSKNNIQKKVKVKKRGTVPPISAGPYSSDESEEEAESTAEEEEDSDEETSSIVPTSKNNIQKKVKVKKRGTVPPISAGPYSSDESEEEAESTAEEEDDSDEETSSIVPTFVSGVEATGGDEEEGSSEEDAGVEEEESSEDEENSEDSDEDAEEDEEKASEDEGEESESSEESNEPTPQDENKSNLQPKKEPDSPFISESAKSSKRKEPGSTRDSPRFQTNQENNVGAKEASPKRENYNTARDLPPAIKDNKTGGKARDSKSNQTDLSLPRRRMLESFPSNQLRSLIGSSLPQTVSSCTSIPQQLDMFGNIIKKEKHFPRSTVLRMAPSDYSSTNISGVTTWWDEEGKRDTEEGDWSRHAVFGSEPQKRTVRLGASGEKGQSDPMTKTFKAAVTYLRGDGILLKSFMKRGKEPPKPPPIKYKYKKQPWSMEVKCTGETRHLEIQDNPKGRELCDHPECVFNRCNNSDYSGVDEASCRPTGRPCLRVQPDLKVTLDDVKDILDRSGKENDLFDVKIIPAVPKHVSNVPDCETCPCSANRFRPFFPDLFEENFLLPFAEKITEFAVFEGSQKYMRQYPRYTEEDIDAVTDKMVYYAILNGTAKFCVKDAFRSTILDLQSEDMLAELTKEVIKDLGKKCMVNYISEAAIEHGRRQMIIDKFINESKEKATAKEGEKPPIGSDKEIWNYTPEDDTKFPAFCPPVPGEERADGVVPTYIPAVDLKKMEMFYQPTNVRTKVKANKLLKRVFKKCNISTDPPPDETESAGPPKESDAQISKGVNELLDDIVSTVVVAEELNLDLNNIRSIRNQAPRPSQGFMATDDESTPTAATAENVVNDQPLPSQAADDVYKKTCASAVAEELRLRWAQVTNDEEDGMPEFIGEENAEDHVEEKISKKPSRRGKTHEEREVLGRGREERYVYGTVDDDDKNLDDEEELSPGETDEDDEEDMESIPSTSMRAKSRTKLSKFFKKITRPKHKERKTQRNPIQKFFLKMTESKKRHMAKEESEREGSFEDDEPGCSGLTILGGSSSNTDTEGMPCTSRYGNNQVIIGRDSFWKRTTDIVKNPDGKTPDPSTGFPGLLLPATSPADTSSSEELPGNSYQADEKAFGSIPHFMMVKFGNIARHLKALRSEVKEGEKKNTKKCPFPSSGVFERRCTEDSDDDYVVFVPKDRQGPLNERNTTKENGKTLNTEGYNMVGDRANRATSEKKKVVDKSKQHELQTRSNDGRLPASSDTVSRNRRPTWKKCPYPSGIRTVGSQQEEPSYKPSQSDDSKSDLPETISVPDVKSADSSNGDGGLSYPRRTPSTPSEFRSMWHLVENRESNIAHKETREEEREAEEGQTTEPISTTCTSDTSLSMKTYRVFGNEKEHIRIGRARPGVTKERCPLTMPISKHIINIGKSKESVRKAGVVSPPQNSTILVKIGEKSDTESDDDGMSNVPLFSSRSSTTKTRGATRHDYENPYEKYNPSPDACPDCSGIQQTPKLLLVNEGVKKVARVEELVDEATNKHEIPRANKELTDEEILARVRNMFHPPPAPSSPPTTQSTSSPSDDLLKEMLQFARSCNYDISQLVRIREALNANSVPSAPKVRLDENGHFSEQVQYSTPDKFKTSQNEKLKDDSSMDEESLNGDRPAQKEELRYTTNDLLEDLDAEMLQVRKAMGTPSPEDKNTHAIPQTSTGADMIEMSASNQPSPNQLISSLDNLRKTLYEFAGIVKCTCRGGVPNQKCLRHSASSTSCAISAACEENKNKLSEMFKEIRVRTERIRERFESDGGSDYAGSTANSDAGGKKGKIKKARLTRKRNETTRASEKGLVTAYRRRFERSDLGSRERFGDLHYLAKEANDRPVDHPTDDKASSKNEILPTPSPLSPRCRDERLESDDSTSSQISSFFESHIRPRLNLASSDSNSRPKNGKKRRKAGVPTPSCLAVKNGQRRHTVIGRRHQAPRTVPKCTKGRPRPKKERMSQCKQEILAENKTCSSRDETNLKAKEKVSDVPKKVFPKKTKVLRSSGNITDHHRMRESEERLKLLHQKYQLSDSLSSPDSGSEDNVESTERQFSPRVSANTPSKVGNDECTGTSKDAKSGTSYTTESKLSTSEQTMTPEKVRTQEGVQLSVPALRQFFETFGEEVEKHSYASIDGSEMTNTSSRTGLSVRWDTLRHRVKALVPSGSPRAKKTRIFRSSTNRSPEPSEESEYEEIKVKPKKDAKKKDEQQPTPNIVDEEVTPAQAVQEEAAPQQEAGQLEGAPPEVYDTAREVPPEQVGQDQNPLAPEPGNLPGMPPLDATGQPISPALPPYMLPGMQVPLVPYVPQPGQPIQAPLWTPMPYPGQQIPPGDAVQGPTNAEPPLWTPAPYPGQQMPPGGAVQSPSNAEEVNKLPCRPVNISPSTLDFLTGFPTVHAEANAPPLKEDKDDAPICYDEESEYSTGSEKMVMRWRDRFMLRNCSSTELQPRKLTPRFCEKESCGRQKPKTPRLCEKAKCGRRKSKIGKPKKVIEARPRPVPSTFPCRRQFPPDYCSVVRECRLSSSDISLPGGKCKEKKGDKGHEKKDAREKESNHACPKICNRFSMPPSCRNHRRRKNAEMFFRSNFAFHWDMLPRMVSDVIFSSGPVVDMTVRFLAFIIIIFYFFQGELLHSNNFPT